LCLSSKIVLCLVNQLEHCTDFGLQFRMSRLDPTRDRLLSLLTEQRTCLVSLYPLCGLSNILRRTWNSYRSPFGGNEHSGQGQAGQARKNILSRSVRSRVLPDFHGYPHTHFVDVSSLRCKFNFGVGLPRHARFVSSLSHSAICRRGTVNGVDQRVLRVRALKDGGPPVPPILWLDIGQR
jgi:hypothetical protein